VKVMNLKIVEEVWDTLERVHEGDESVREENL
jgi:hypothetical protein